MVGESEEIIVSTNAAMEKWRQGDFFFDEDLFFIHLANLACPLTLEAKAMACERASTGEPLEVEGVASAVVGYVVLTQTCDLVRDCGKRSYVELSPLVEVAESILNEVRLLRRPAFAFVPNAATKMVVADLDRIVTVEKSILVRYVPTEGCNDESERRAFADALARHRTRAAFPDDFNRNMEPVREYLKKIHRSNDAEGLLIQSIGDIRITASPNWGAEKISIFLWFIQTPPAASPNVDVSPYIAKWLAMFRPSEKYDLQAIVCKLDDLKASDYVGSDRLDLDQLSAS